MISTGVEALDERLGGLQSGGVYVFAGPAASGKSLLGLHFLTAGLARDEQCVLITAEQSAKIEGQAAFIGYAGVRLTDHAGLQILEFPGHLDGGAPAVALWLSSRLRWPRPSRIVIDGLERFAEFERAPHGLTTELIRMLGETGATAYLLLQTNALALRDHPAADIVFGRAAGVFRLDLSEPGKRTFHCEQSPAGAFRSERLAYSLRAGAGFTEELPLAAPVLTAEQRRKLLLLDEIGAVGPDLLAALDHDYELQLLRGTTGVLGTLTAGQYGMLVVTVDPFDQARATDLVHALRRGGNAVPVVCLAPSRGLRSTTRSRCLRSGADDFLVAELPVSEVADRIHTAWLRGAHRRSGLNQVGQIMQPLGDDGAPRLMTEAELLQAMDTLLAEQPPLFFGYVEFSVGGTSPQVVWPAVRSRMRVGEGDIIGLLSGNRFACVLDRITPEQTAQVLERIRNAHPGLAALSDVQAIASPADIDALRVRLAAVRERSRPLAAGSA